MNITDILIPSRPKKPQKQIATVISTPPLARARKIEYGKISRAGGSKDWNEPEFDFHLIASCLSTESMFRRVVDKYKELIWMNGYKITGKNPVTITYIKERIKQISTSTDTPFDMFLRDVSQQLITYSNCFIEKVRSSSNSIIINGKKISPVIGYYVVDATSTKIAKGPNGKVMGYKQEIPGQEVSPEWTPNNMIHIVKDKEAGLTYGTPMVAPVLDDIRALRRMEENVEMLVYQHAIPLYQYKVGDADHPADDYALSNAQSIFNQGVPDGTLVTPFYHEITAIGAEGRALRVEGFMEYFRERIFSGLGTSSVAMGLGGSANRSTSEVLERAMYVTVREFQTIIQKYFEEKIFSELLLEGGFDSTKDEDKVTMFFPEVDLDSKIKLENHLVNVYQGNLLSSTETRERMGMDPFDEVTYMDTYLFNVDLIKAMVQAVDEPVLTSYGPGIIKRLAKFRGTGVPTPGAGAGITPAKSTSPGGVRAAISITKPSNQYGTKAGPGSTKNSEDSIIDAQLSPVTTRQLEDLGHSSYYEVIKIHYDNYKEKLLGVLEAESISGTQINKKDIIADMREEYLDHMIGECEIYIKHAIISGVNDLYEQVGATHNHIPGDDAIQYAMRKCREWLDTTTDYVTEAAISAYQDGGSNRVSALFDINNYRIKHGSRNELTRMYNIGFIAAGRSLDYTKFLLESHDSDEDGICKQHEGKAYSIDNSTPWDAIPPGYMTHPLCTCRIRVAN